VANAYRDFRRRQHQIRLQGEDRARVAHDQVDDQARRVTELFKRVLG